MRMCRILTIVFLAGLLCAAARAQEPKPLVLADFELGENSKVTFDGEIVTENARHGQRAMKMKNHGQGFTCLALTDRPTLAKLKDYVLLRVSIFNPQDRMVRYAVRVDDAKSVDYGSRYNDENFVAPPGWSLLELNLTSLLRSSSRNFAERGKLDVSQLTLINIFMLPQKEPTVLYFDNMRAGGSGLPELKGLQAFDFGPANAAVFPGFEGVHEDTMYTPARGYGWTVKPEGGDQLWTPDDLGGDVLRGGEFRIDAPNGTYDVYVCIDAFGTWHAAPYFNWRKFTINGKVELDEKMTAKRFMNDIYLRLEENDDLPGQDLWQKYVMSRCPVREFHVRVTDGKLLMKLDSDTMWGRSWAFLAVYRYGARWSGHEWVHGTLNRLRKDRFENNLTVVVPPASHEPPRDISPAYRATVGFIPFVRHPMQDINVNDAPSDAERKASVVMEAARGEREHAQIGAYSYANVEKFTVSVSDLTGPNGAKILASAVRVRRTRYFLKRQGGVRAGTILPYMLLDFDTIALAPGITRGFWLTVSVPEDAAPGEYTGAVRMGSDLVTKRLQIMLKVYPFALEKARSMPLSVTGTTAGFWRANYPELEDRWWETAETVMKDLADHGMNAVTGGPGAKLVAVRDGKAEIDYTDMDRWLALAVKHGLTMTGDSYQGLDIHGIPRDSRDMAANERIARENYGVSYADLIRIVFEDVTRHAAEKHWPPRIYYLLDEPRPEFRNVETALELTKIWTAAAPNTLFSGYYSTGDGRDPYFQTMPVSIAHYNALAAKLTQDAGKQLWDYDGARERYNIGRWAFKASKAGLKGYLRNGYMYVNNDPYFDFSDAEASWSVVYPSKNGLNAAVGWERTGEGVDDFRYLEMLDKLIVKARATLAAKTEADAAETWLNASLAPIVLTRRPTADLAPEEFDAFKRTMAAHIVTLKRALGEQ